MFDNNVFKKNSCKNIEENSEVIGYELQTLITYYRGIPLSMLEFIKIEVDDVEVSSKDIRISIDRKDWFSLTESVTVTTYKWEYGEPLYIRVLKTGGLSKGNHQVKLTVATRTAYIPVPLVGVKVRTVAV
ncbi:C-glycoside deglycosidase beta subunit domain-containing protein [Enterococcus dongliensis]|uniref:C-glycoside deglycosidase beta subunit domain-containing protein n=1 Tax=Enterococcus dongliensis TaxID=2559925 RepID=UPI00288E1EB3|nr:DUF6379 domain-containing protein [Enterococcus dongliensis]MDT2674973.1 DUF6379 domain-containing protein [Enterococcus dongliensis]